MVWHAERGQSVHIIKAGRGIHGWTFLWGQNLHVNVRWHWSKPGIFISPYRVLHVVFTVLTVYRYNLYFCVVCN